MLGRDLSSNTYDLLITIGSPKEKRIPKIEAAAATKVTSPKSVTLNLLDNIGVRRIGPRPWPSAPNR